MKLSSKSKAIWGSGCKGFTLIEMVLVLAVIALIIGAGVGHLIGVNETTRNRTSAMKLNGLRAALELYQLNSGRYPTQDQGLQALLSKPTKAPVPRTWTQHVKSLESLQDPWGNAFQYRRPGLDGNEYDLFSLGNDGVESSDDIRE